MTGDVSLVAYVGPAGDRNSRARDGVRRLTSDLASIFGWPYVELGTPIAPLGAWWDVELEVARPGLLELQSHFSALIRDGQAPLLVLPRCVASIATLPVLARAHSDAAVVWFDAHGDCNVPDHSTSGYLGGLILTAASGIWNSGLGGDLDLSNVVLVGSRDLDPFEAELVDRSGIALIAPGPDLAGRVRAAIRKRPVYIHLDCDVLDPGLVPSDYQVIGGLSLADLSSVSEMLAQHDVLGFEIAEFEGTWPDGQPGETGPLIDAIRPLLGALTQDMVGVGDLSMFTEWSDKLDAASDAR